MKNTWIVIICSVLVLAGLYWMFDRGGNDNMANLSNTEKPLSTDLTPNASTTNPSDINQTNNTKITTATFHTTKGDITIEFSTTTPITVANFIKLAESGFYNGTKFHRVVKGFVDQGGDPLTKDDSLKDKWGTGGPGYTFNDEIGPNNHNDLGTIAMANSGPNTNGSQFYFNAASNNQLDQSYTVFGKVISGLDVVMAINDVPVDSATRPLDPIIIQSITLN